MKKIIQAIIIFTVFELLAISCTHIDSERTPSSILKNKSCSFLIKQILKEKNSSELLDKSLEKGATYAVLLNEKSEALYLNFRNIIEENGEVFLNFQKLSNDDVIRSDQAKKIKLSEIFALKKTKLTKAPKNENINPLTYLFSPLVIIPIISNITSWGNLMFRPYKALIKNESIEVVSKKAGQCRFRSAKLF